MSRQLRCERCNKIFICDSENIDVCQCRDIKLSQQQRDGLSESYSDCLCRDCLRELQQSSDSVETN